ncbi:MAG: adenylosuccinate synthase [Longimicrobiales bacterium]
MFQGPRDGRCTVVVGGQWGDEGKGKIVDVLAEEADVISRYQGGANAGHTVHVGEEEFILHQIPSGILHPDKRCLMGNGVVLDPIQFFEEYDAVEARGISLGGRVGLSLRAHLLLPYHRLLDKAREGKTTRKIGTTGRGIGPAYEDKVARRGMRVVDMKDEARARALLQDGLARTQATLEAMGMSDLGEAEGCVEEAMDLRERLLALATDVGLEIQQALYGGRRVLLEGAQGTALDVDHGTYPYVTSSTTTAGGAASGAGIGPTAIDEVLGVMKAYITRVGNGPLPTAFSPEMDEKVRTLGSEFGATTGRPRRCGWFDGVLARYSARVNGLTGLAITKMDVLDTLPEVAIATGYRTPDGVAEEFPADTSTLGDVEPIYETHPGWQTSTGGARSLGDLPSQARAYLDRLEEITSTPVRMISVGTRRSQIIRVS